MNRHQPAARVSPGSRESSPKEPGPREHGPKEHGSQEAGAWASRATQADARDARAARIVEALGDRPVILIGLMGAGKSSLGKRLASRLRVEFCDADTEIELAAKMSIKDIFDAYGETFFRDGERRVVARMLKEGSRVLATGGGAFMNEQTRANIAATGISLWLNAELDVLMRRVRRRTDRPLLRGPDPEGTMRKLMDLRYPTYALADITVMSADLSHEDVLEDVMLALELYLGLSKAAA